MQLGKAQECAKPLIAAGQQVCPRCTPHPLKLPHLCSMAGVPSGLSGRNSCHTPKSFFMAQCSGWGSQALNSPISASACEGGGDARALQQWAQHGKSPTCEMQRTRLCSGAAAHPAQAAADAGAPAQAPTADGAPAQAAADGKAPAQAAADAGAPAHLGTRRPLAVPDALLALMLAAVQAIEVVACGWACVE